jgi:E3 ubiquitin-protein ligase HUWE1
LISGTPDIDVEDWRSATEYHGYTASDAVIVWWWRALKSFSRSDRAKVLSFATGTAKVPLGGFSELQVWISLLALSLVNCDRRELTASNVSRYIKTTASWTGYLRRILVLIRVSGVAWTSHVYSSYCSAVDLPQYSSYEKLRQQLLLAINEGGEGFGFA